MCAPKRLSEVGDWTTAERELISILRSRIIQKDPWQMGGEAVALTSIALSLDKIAQSLLRIASSTERP
jgi:hypothetical protein